MKIYEELRFIKTQLRTLFTIPPILVAVGSMTQDWWDEIVQIPAYNANGRLIQLDENFLETHRRGTTNPRSESRQKGGLP
ncbi:hypothetical protein RB195_023218 [Necator americanus]|uniref:Uncharacterized protein n=1 Tax=Necator americanus TaxID=51031 RepID=A0ABR1EII1_NECAM